MKPVPRTALGLSVVVLGTAAAASLVTLLWAGSFPDPSPGTIENRVLAEARGWSAATLLVAIPLGVVSLATTWRGSLRGRLVWLGVLAYCTYTYLELAVSPPFTALYLLYVVAFACAVPALVLGAASVDHHELRRAFGHRVPRRSVAIFSLLLGALLALAWLKDIVGRTLAGDFGWPAGAVAVGHVVHALDLGLQVPLALATGVLLLRRRPEALLVAAVMLFNMVCMGAALTGMVYCASADAGTSLWIVAPFALAWLTGVALALRFVRSGLHTTSTLEPASG